MNLDVEVLADAAELRDEALQANLPHYFTVTADGLAYCPDASMPAVLSGVRSVLVDPERAEQLLDVLADRANGARA